MRPHLVLVLVSAAVAVGACGDPLHPPAPENWVQAGEQYSLVIADHFDFDCRATVDWPTDPDICAAGTGVLRVSVDSLAGTIRVDSSFGALPQTDRRYEINCVEVVILPGQFYCESAARAHATLSGRYATCQLVETSYRAAGCTPHALQRPVTLIQRHDGVGMLLYLHFVDARGETVWYQLVGTRAPDGSVIGMEQHTEPRQERGRTWQLRP
jgi:hypothetical protein